MDAINIICYPLRGFHMDLYELESRLCTYNVNVLLLLVIHLFIQSQMLGMKVLSFIHENDLEDYVLHKREGLHMDIRDFTGYPDVGCDAFRDTPTQVALLGEFSHDQSDFVEDATPSSGPSQRGKSKRRIFGSILDDDDDEALTVSHSSPGDVGEHIDEPSFRKDFVHISSRDPEDLVHDVKIGLEGMTSRKGKERRVFHIAEVKECIDLTGDSEEEEEELNPAKRKRMTSPPLEESASTVKVEKRVPMKEETVTQSELLNALQQAREEMEQREVLRRMEYEEKETQRKKDDDERIERMMMGLASQIMQQFSSGHLHPQFLLPSAIQLPIMASPCEPSGSVGLLAPTMPRIVNYPLATPVSTPLAIAEVQAKSVGSERQEIQVPPKLDVTPLISVVPDPVKSPREEVVVDSKDGRDVDVEMSVHAGEGSEEGYNVNDIVSNPEHGEKVNQP